MDFSEAITQGFCTWPLILVRHTSRDFIQIMYRKKNSVSIAQTPLSCSASTVWQGYNDRVPHI